MTDINQTIATLSFTSVGSRTRKLDLWTQFCNTNPEESNAEGRRRAHELLDFIQINDIPFLLGHVVRAIIDHGAQTGAVETGFFQVIASAACRGHIPEQQRRAEKVPHLTLVAGG